MGRGGRSPPAKSEVWPEGKEEKTKSILVATDGSPAAEEAVRFGIELGDEHDAKVAFVRVVPRFRAVPGPYSVAIGYSPTDEDRAPLEAAVELATEAGVASQAELRAGQDVVDEILGCANSLDADVIVVGSRGLGAIAGALLGSVSRRLLHDAKQPVLIVKSHAVREEATAGSAVQGMAR